MHVPKIKIILSKGFMALVCAWSLLIYSACTDREQQAFVDELNDKAYYFHYRNIDSTLYYAEKALAESNSYENGKAEALNNIAFYDIVKMNFARADSILNEVTKTTDNEVELLVADVQHMRICQRKSENKDYYLYQNSAQNRLDRIKETFNETTLSTLRGTRYLRLLKRIAYAESEFYIVSSTYYYYVGLEEKSREAIFSINADELIQVDSAQVANYLYNIGAGGIITAETKDAITEAETEYLLQCQYVAKKCGYVFWQANALQALAEQHKFNENDNDDDNYNDNRRTAEPQNSKTVKPHNRITAKPNNRKTSKPQNSKTVKPHNLTTLKPHNLKTNIDLAIEEAQQSLQLFEQYGDIYQIAGAYRTLASCYWSKGDYESSLENLKSALNNDIRIDLAPELVASIHERLCVVYSALDNKPESDLNRNFYLDLQDGTRQDRYLESRAEELGKSERQLNIMLFCVAAAIILLVVLMIVFYKMKKRREEHYDIHQLLTPLQKWSENNQQQLEALEDTYEETKERINLGKQKYTDNIRKNVESRAKISLVNSIVPFIDRMIKEVNAKNNNKDLTYVAELTDKVNEYNSLLTEWIKMRQGELSLKIESFSLKSLFDIVSKAKVSCQIKGVSLTVDNTDETIKADRTLTLFMLNTLVDNARKYTPKGGKIHVSATSIGDCVEISVADTGEGLTEEQLSAVFNHKVSESQQSKDGGKGFGFGLMNCKGIIEKYKKVSSLFRNVVIAAESKKGEGSRFYFRLPKGKHFSILLLMLFFATKINAQTAAIYADSAYTKNIKGDYESAILYADSCISTGTKDGNALLTAYNEAAVAALALHRWDVYEENNRNYVQLFKELSTDSNLPTYCSELQKSQTNKNIAVILLVILFLCIIPLYYFLFYRQRVYYLLCVDRIRQINGILLKDIQPKDKLNEILPLIKDDFPDVLKSVVEQILQALRASQQLLESKQNFIDLAEDECRRIDMENGNLHVSNNVLDNCLSTLKHETMYYPNRIHQLVEEFAANPSAEQDSQLTEMVTYYKELYTILDSQAMREVDNYKPNIGVVDILGHKFLGDRLLLEYLFELLGVTENNSTIDKTSEQYLRITLRKPDVKLTDDECKQLFSPEGKNIKMLVCRQIVRDHSQFTHRRGCGIFAQNNNENENDNENENENFTTSQPHNLTTSQPYNLTTEIIITLPRYGQV